MNNAQRAQDQQRVEELCAASVRALTGISDLHFRARSLYQGERRVPVHAVHLQVENYRDFPSHRGVIDSTAMRLRYSDKVIHKQFVPDDPIEKMMFEMLEQFRVESLAAESLPGVRYNLRRRFEVWANEFLGSGLTETDLGIILFSIALISWSRINRVGVPEEFEDLLEPSRMAFKDILGEHFRGLSSTQDDQAIFAQHALEIARVIASSVRHSQENNPVRKVRNEEQRAIFSIILEFDESDGEGFAQADSGVSKTLEELNQKYHVFTKKYDRVVSSVKLVRSVLLDEYRQRLDTLVREQNINIPRLSRLFKAMLSKPRVDGVNFGEESGRIDGSRLSQLITSPAERRLFQQTRYELHAKCVFTILVDCSGSMKQYVDQISVLIDVMTRALEQAEVEVEVLGFSTNTWSGGRAQKDWMIEGQPMNPGRLNEACNIVFKNADSTWRKSRRGLAAFFKQDLFREGIDGEAVEWACERALKRGKERNILMVISDGSPMDTATALANDAFYLDNHLQKVVYKLSQNPKLEIMGLGVGLDLSPYYPQSLAVDLSEGLSNQLFFDILEVLRGHHRR